MVRGKTPLYRAAASVEDRKDAAGAGNWCSARFLHFLETKQPSLTKAPPRDVADALYFGQALSEINCRYSGARGAMYALSQRDLMAKVAQLWDVAEAYENATNAPNLASLVSSRGLCPASRLHRKVVHIF